MATTTFHEYTGDGSDKTFDYSFPTYSVAEVVVEVDGVLVNNYTVDPYNTSGTNTVTFDNTTGTTNTNVCESDGSPKTGLIVRIRRDTNVDTAKATYAAGSSIKAGDLNDNQTQILRALQEEQSTTISTTQIRDSAITTAKIKADNITNALIADDQIDSEHYVAGSIDLEHMSANSVDSDQYVDGSIDLVHMSANSVDSDQYVDGSIDLVHMSANSVDSDQYVDGSVDLIHLSANSVDSSKIVDGSIVNADVNASAAIAGTKVSPAFGSQNISTSGTLASGAATVTGNIAVSGTVDGRDIATDGSKLDGIEASADVTDATNVNAAGAVMNSDLATKGTLIVGDGSGDPTILPVGTNNHVLVADSNEASGVKWSTVSSASGFNNVVEDTTPQLGGALDVQAQEINTSTTNGNIKLTPNGTGVVEVKGNTNPGTLQLNCENNSHSVKIKGPAHSAAASYTLTLPDNDGTVDQVLKTDGSGNLSWGANVVIWTLGINGGADAFTFTGPGFASATDDPTLYLSRGQTYKFINGNSSGTHAFNIEKSDHDETWTAYTTGMTGAGATGGNTMTWTVPMDAPSLFRYISGTTAGMTGMIQVTDGTNTNEGFICSTGSRVSGLEINNGPNGSHMAFFGTHPTGYQPYIQGRAGSVTTLDSADSYSFGNGNLNLKSYGTNTTTPATIKFEGGGSNNTYGVTISGPATAQATSNYTITLPGVVPTANGQVLSATTAGVCSWADGVVINNQAANRLTTIGSTTTQLDGEASLTFEDTTSTGLISGKQITARGFECPATVSDDWTIAAGNNAFFPGPMTVAANKTVTVPANRTLTIV